MKKTHTLRQLKVEIIESLKLFKTELNSGRIHRASIGMTSTLVMIEAPICAKTVTIAILQEGADLDAETKKVIRDNDPTSEEVEEVIVEDLQPCSEYKMMVDLFLNNVDSQQHDLGDFSNDETFFTLPDPDRLKDHFTYDNTTMTLYWDLTKFFDQPCSTAHGLTPDIELVGEKQVEADIDTNSCNSTLLEITFGKEQTFQLSGCELETLRALPRSSALSSVDENLGGGALATITCSLNLPALILICCIAFGL